LTPVQLNSDSNDKGVKLGDILSDVKTFFQFEHSIFLPFCLFAFLRSLAYTNVN